MDLALSKSSSLFQIFDMCLSSKSTFAAIESEVVQSETSGTQKRLLRLLIVSRLYSIGPVDPVVTAETAFILSRSDSEIPKIIEIRIPQSGSSGER